MREAKCPLCGGDLIQSKEFPYFYSCQSTNWKSDSDELCELDDCSAPVPVWETLRRTRKALDVAVDALKSAKTRLELINNSKFANLNNVLQIQSQCEVLKINKALDQITATLENKRK